MTFIDDLNKEHDPANIAAKEAAKKTVAFTKIANKIIDIAKQHIARMYDKHVLSGYYGYSDYEEKPCIIEKEYTDNLTVYRFFKFPKSEYTFEEMNSIKSILEGKFRELGLKSFNVKIKGAEISEGEYRKGFLGMGRSVVVKKPAYIIWFECTW